jgi:hypothetical protein
MSEGKAMREGGKGSFRRVEADQAGPAALGILIPPAQRTFLILRPRSLGCDLLLCRGATDPTFHALSHGEASAAAQSLYRGLREGLARVESAHHLLAHVGPLCFVACARAPGLPYAPLAPGPADADALAGYLSPVGEQEVYFNTRFFERSAP